MIKIIKFVRQSSDGGPALLQRARHKRKEPGHAPLSRFIGAAVFAAFTPFSVAQSTYHQPFVAEPATSGHAHEAAGAVTAATPSAIVECEQSGCGRSGGGAAWVFDGVHGQAAWAVGALADLTIDAFDGQHIQISRADPPGTYSSRWAMPDGVFRAVYIGTVSGDQIHGTVVWNGDVNHPGVWQAAIVNTLCDSVNDCPVTPDQLIVLGDRAYRAKQMESALRCFKAAGGLGNPTAEGLAALVLYEEKGSPARRQEGFQLAQDSASHNNAVGMIVLGKMYRDGVGTQANPAQAKFWTDKGKAQQDEADKAQAARQQQLNAAAGVLAFLGGALLQSWNPEADAAYKKCTDYADAHHMSRYDLNCVKVYDPQPPPGPFD